MPQEEALMSIKGMEPTASSVRSCVASASGSGSCLALRFEPVTSCQKDQGSAFHYDTDDSGGRSRSSTSLLCGLQQIASPEGPLSAYTYNTQVSCRIESYLNSQYLSVQV